jgi:DNA repair exonuclease SbcCD ATPase subunit
LSDAKILSAMQKDFLDWAYRSAQVTVRANEKLKVYAGPEVSQADFRTRCSEAARQGREDELQALDKSYDTKLERLEQKISQEERELREDEAEVSQRKLEEYSTHAETLLGLFGGRKRRLSSSLTKRRMTSKAQADVEESKDAIEEYQKQMDEIEQELAQAQEEVNRKWSEIVEDINEIKVKPLKKDVLVELFGVAWFPYHIVQVGENVIELPGYAEE